MRACPGLGSDGWPHSACNCTHSRRFHPWRPRGIRLAPTRLTFPDHPRSGPRRVRTASSRRSSVGKPSEQISCPLDDNDFEREREHELGETSSDEFFDESTVFADVSTLQAELQTVLDDVERVQNSWLVLEKDRPRHGLVMMRRFFEIAPAALRVFSFGKEATGARAGWTEIPLCFHRLVAARVTEFDSLACRRRGGYLCVHL